MSDLVFVDTNVLIYARDRKNVAKRTRAGEWLDALGQSDAGVLNLQVLNELARWVLAHERRSIEDVREEIEGLRAWGDKPVDQDEVDLAWEVRGRFGFQWFDCLLVAAASLGGCGFFLTEDMTEGVAFEGVTLINPFHSVPREFLSRD